jgi:co-chaperonin GroES (HSP10)
MPQYSAQIIDKLQPLHDHVLVCDMNFDARTTLGGVIIKPMDGKLEGIHPRWARVYAVGPEQTAVRPGQYVLVAHGRWTRGIEVQDAEGEKTLRRVDNNDIMAVSDEPHQDEIVMQGL